MPCDTVFWVWFDLWRLLWETVLNCSSLNNNIGNFYASILIYRGCLNAHTVCANFGAHCYCIILLKIKNVLMSSFSRAIQIKTTTLFSCPEQLNRWPCHWLTEWVTFRFWHYRVTLETCDLWDFWSEWWGDMTWPKNTYIPTKSPT